MVTLIWMFQVWVSRPSAVSWTQWFGALPGGRHARAACVYAEAWWLYPEIRDLHRFAEWGRETFHAAAERVEFAEPFVQTGRTQLTGGPVIAVLGALVAARARGRLGM